MFTKNERSSFKYWFAHWCAYQMTALNLKCWKFRFLFHDIEKPWLKLLVRDYKKVQQWHRKYNRHHIEYFMKHDDADYLGMVIDWECSRFTKESQPLNARQELDRILIIKDLDIRQRNKLRKNIVEVMETIGL